MMATTDVVTDQQQCPQQAVSEMGTSETIEALSREVEQLKAKLEEERSKLTDVDGNANSSCELSYRFDSSAAGRYSTLNLYQN
jgi:hypothetical protein